MDRDVAVLEKPTVPFPFPSIPSALTNDATTIAFNIRKVLDQIIFRALTSRTVDEFRKTRNRDFREFCTFSKALSEFITKSTNPCAGGRLSLDGMHANECEFQTSAPGLIGLNAANEALFHFITLRKVFELVYAIIARDCDTEIDRVAAKHCMYASLWVTYHYECLLVLCKKRLSISDEILRELFSSLAIADVAYIAAKQGFQPRYPERQLHKFQTAKPSGNRPHGDVETISEDALRVYEEWAPSRDRANKETIPQ